MTVSDFYYREYAFPSDIAIRSWILTTDCGIFEHNLRLQLKKLNATGVELKRQYAYAK